jgi:two-component system, chemotaxis family, chemotaxis protein CheY
MAPSNPLPADVVALLASRKVLVVDDQPSTRKVLRAMLMSMGIVNIRDANDGDSGLDLVSTFMPHIVLLDWEMPELDGAAFVRTVRSPDTFPLPDVPIIMLTGHSERSRVVAAARLGVNEYLVKPVSIQALQSRVLSIVTNPRPMVRKGDYYGPAPRSQPGFKSEDDPLHAPLAVLN